MARMLWLQCVAGTSFVLAMGCQTPNGPGTIRTLDSAGGAAAVSTPRFPATAPGTPAAKSSSTLPPPVMPQIGNSQTKIGSPAAQPGQVTTSGVLKLRPLDPSAAGTAQQNDAFPPANPGAVNALRNASPAAFDEWNDPRSNPAIYAPVVGRQAEVPAQMPPPAMTSLPNALPPGSGGAVSYPNVAMPQVNMPVVPSMPTPTFPSTPTFPPPPAMPNASLQSNSPAPNLNAPGASRQAIYPGTNP